MKIIFYLLLSSLHFLSCEKESNGEKNISVNDDFESGNDGWMAGFADYSTAMDSASLKFVSGVSNLPAPLDTAKKGFTIGASNISDDLFMYLKKQVTGLAPNKSYSFNFQLDIASDAPSNFFGIGGPPGEAVVVKVGASPAEPSTVLVNDFYEVNIDKGGNSDGGADMIVVGNVANGLDSIEYKMINRQGQFTATTDSSGNIWLIVGTESGFEGRTVLYYDRITVTVSRQR